MNVIETALAGVRILEPQVFGDARGWFMESWSKKKMEDAGILVDFVQDNHSFSAQKGTLRGLHYQLNPMAQAKLLRVSRGAIFDVAVDIRRGSPTYAKWVGVELTAENARQLFIPRGFAHGFITLTDDVEVQYKADNFYAPTCDGNIRWDDPEIGVAWPLAPVVLSEKDAKAPLLSARTELNFTYSL
jgi:dTDP-4-dehydrorhamnose 3,5-epimerase